MGYVVAGYTAVLGILSLYAVQLLWRRRRLAREASAVEARLGGADQGAAGGLSPGGVRAEQPELR